MCLIIYRPAETNAQIPSSHIRNAAEGNDDGFGLMWALHGNIHIERTLNPDPVYHQRLIEAVPEGVPLICHWRYGTHGTKSMETVHPFLVTDGLYLAHNGILNIRCQDKGLTDTQNFIVDIMRPDLLSDPHQYGTSDFLDCYEAMIGPGNKFAMMREDGRVVLVNESEGQWRDELWYSNGCGFYSPAHYWTSSYKSYTAAKHDWKSSKEQSRLHEVFDESGAAHTVQEAPLSDADKYQDLSDLAELTEEQIAAVAWRDPGLIAALVYERLQYDLYCENECGGYDYQEAREAKLALAHADDDCEGYSG